MKKLLLLLWSTSMTATPLAAQNERLEDYRGKTVLVFSPHPDDDTFAVGGTLALIAAHGNKVIIAIYTNDNKGSYDQAMTSERLARIRKAEEEAACDVLGVPGGNVVWMGHDDGELEYVPARLLCGQATRIIRQYRPDAVLSVDPGEWYERWHKSDHRMAALNTVDAVRAAEFHLYYPEHLLVDRLQPYKVPNLFFYYAKPQDANCFVNIDLVFEKKLEAASKHVSQFEPAISKYRPDWEDGALARFKEEFRSQHEKRDGHYVESYRYATGFNQQ